MDDIEDKYYHYFDAEHKHYIGHIHGYKIVDPSGQEMEQLFTSDYEANSVAASLNLSNNATSLYRVIQIF